MLGSSRVRVAAALQPRPPGGKQPSATPQSQGQAHLPLPKRLHGLKIALPAFVGGLTASGVEQPGARQGMPSLTPAPVGGPAPAPPAPLDEVCPKHTRKLAHQTVDWLLAAVAVGLLLLCCPLGLVFSLVLIVSDMVATLVLQLFQHSPLDTSHTLLATLATLAVGLYRRADFVRRLAARWLRRRR